MHNFKLKITCLAVAAALGLTACGGGGSSSGESTLTTSNITGVITGFGSVYVDGIEYETDNANFTLDGVAGTENQLAIGMVVSLQGTVNADGTTGTATAVTFADEVEGTLLANNFLADGTLNIMGQTVHIIDTTSLDSEVLGVDTFESIAVGNVVEVSGFSDGSGTIYATRIEVKKEALEVGDNIELKGVISSLDTAGQTFTLGGLTIDYSSAQLDDISEITNGLYVEIKSDQALSGTTMIASKIELEGDGKHDERGDDGEEMEFEGIIMSVDSNFIVVNGQTVYFNDETEYEHGDESRLVVGTKLKVEGEFNTEGLLIAEEFKFKEEGDTEISSHVESVDTNASTLTMMGLTFHIKNTTIMKDERDEDGQTAVRYFDIADIAAGDWLEIRAYYDELNSQWVATQLERDDKDLDELASIEGIVVDNTTLNQLTVATLTVDYSAVSNFTANIGDKVEMEGSYTDNLFTVTEISIDD